MTAAGCEDDAENELDRVSNTLFVQQAASSDVFEIQVSTSAANKASTAEVRQYAQQMVSDHTQARIELKSIAAQKNITVPDSMAPEKQALRDRLSSRNGVAFDKEYMDIQVQVHEENVTMFESAAEQVPDADLRAYARSQLPILRMHLNQARQLKAATDQL
ncbi:DUF4142 domain-containing protein [Pontibacter ruber]|uniref:DUF4142 domain-containing protein n=1 Tax=Pontibacter ruber TaxID=1343895 RepID=A0ABW5CT56_9BACT